MAALVLGLAGAHIFGSGSFGAMALGLAGSFIDKALFGGGKKQHIEGPRLDSLSITSSTEGTAVQRVLALYRVNTQVIWATNLEEVVTTESQGGKGGLFGGGGGATVTKYTYFANFALGLCAGPIDGVIRAWADGKPLDLTKHTHRIYLGTETQTPDALIETKEDKEISAFRGLAYIVFERMALEKFGNRLPNITVEVLRRPVSGADPIKKLMGISLSGVNEFALATDTVNGGLVGPPATSDDEITYVPVDQLAPINVRKDKKPSVTAAVDAIQAVAPDVEIVNLPVVWFGDDLRCGECALKPRVSSQAEKTAPLIWQVSGPAPVEVVAAADEVEPTSPYTEPRKTADIYSGNFSRQAGFITTTALGEFVNGNGTNFNGLGVGWVMRTDVEGNEQQFTVEEIFSDTSMRVSPAPQLTQIEVPWSAYADEGGDGGEGGSPADSAVIQAIKLLKDRNLNVMLTPTLQMDIRAENEKPNPYSNNAATLGQPAYPLASRITCSPAAGFTGTVDKTAAAATQVDAFFGTATAASFGPWEEDYSLHGGKVLLKGGTIPFLGPEGEWSYSRFILHYASIAKQAQFGDGDAFVIGSGLKGLTRIRSSATAYPFVTKLIALAASCRAVLGPDVRISYAADWDEWMNHRPADGSGDVLFHLDPLWAAADIDFIGVNNYLPLSDWRAGLSHLDALAGADAIHNPDYLAGNVRAGEHYDWYYASAADRDNQVRTDIVDPLAPTTDEPWVFRPKDFRGWWENEHHNRPGGVRSGSPTGWSPESKPLWFTEFGCVAMDKGTNQPDAIRDEKSDDSVLPYYSGGDYDSAIQYAYFVAMMDYWLRDKNNPDSSVVSGVRMLERMIAYTWSSDHIQFVEGRSRVMNSVGMSVPLADAIRDICTATPPTADTPQPSPLVPIDAKRVYDLVPGYYMEGVMSPRSAIEPLARIFMFDAAEIDGVIHFRQRRYLPPSLSFTQDDLVDEKGDGQLYNLTRTQETDLPRVVQLNTVDPKNEDQRGNFSSRRLRGTSERTVQFDVPIMMDKDEAEVRAHALLYDEWLARERAQFSLPPSALGLYPSDVITVDFNGRPLDLRINSIGLEFHRPVKAVRNRVSVYDFRAPVPRTDARRRDRSHLAGPAALVIMDLPLFRDTQVAGAPLLAAYANPWHGALVYRSSIIGGFELDSVIEAPATMGRLHEVFRRGPAARWDNANALVVRIPKHLTLQSLDEHLVMQGGNLCAVRVGGNKWEVLAFANAELTAPGVYRLTRLLRGLRGTDDNMVDEVRKNAAFVLLNDAIQQSTARVDLLGTKLAWRYGPASQPINDSSYRTSFYTFNGLGLRPPSPMGLKARRLPNQDVSITWIRRSRLSADAWEPEDVPLGEEKELYRIRIFREGVAKRGLNVAAPEYVYKRSEQIADFGELPRTLDVAVAQRSVKWGLGAFRSQTIDVAPNMRRMLSVATQELLDAAMVRPGVFIEDTIDEFIRAAQGEGEWAYLDALYLLVTHHEQFCLLNWIDPAAYKLTPLGSYFSGIRGTHVAASGAISEYLDTGFNPTVSGIFTQNSNHIGIVSATTGREAQTSIGIESHLINPRTLGNTIVARSSSVSNDTTANKVGAGHFVANRTGAGGYKVFRDGLEVVEFTRVADTLSNESIGICGRPGVTSSRMLSAAHFGNGMPDAVVASFSARLSSLIAEMQNG